MTEQQKQDMLAAVRKDVADYRRIVGGPPPEHTPDQPGREWPLLTLAVILRLVLVAALLGGAAAAVVWVVPAR